MVRLLTATFALLTLIACSSQSPSAHKELTASEYDLLVTQKRNTLPRADFKIWLQGQRESLVAQREGIVGALEATSNRGSYQETMTSPMGSGGTSDFNVQMTNLELKRLEERKRLIESKVRTIDALLSNMPE